jgi:hypothetical protein
MDQIETIYDNRVRPGLIGVASEDVEISCFLLKH